MPVSMTSKIVISREFRDDFFVIVPVFDEYLAVKVGVLLQAGLRIGSSQVNEVDKLPNCLFVPF